MRSFANSIVLVIGLLFLLQSVLLVVASPARHGPSLNKSLLFQHPVFRAFSDRLAAARQQRLGDDPTQRDPAALATSQGANSKAEKRSLLHPPTPQTMDHPKTLSDPSMSPHAGAADLLFLRSSRTPLASMQSLLTDSSTVPSRVASQSSLRGTSPRGLDKVKKTQHEKRSKGRSLLSVELTAIEVPAAKSTSTALQSRSPATVASRVLTPILTDAPLSTSSLVADTVPSQVSSSSVSPMVSTSPLLNSPEDAALLDKSTTPLSFFAVLGQFCGALAGLCFTVQYIPQTLHNYRRHSVRGFSATSIIIKFVGATFMTVNTYVLQETWAVVLYGLFNVCQHAIFLLQFEWYANDDELSSSLDRKPARNRFLSSILYWLMFPMLPIWLAIYFPGSVVWTSSIKPLCQVLSHLPQLKACYDIRSTKGVSLVTQHLNILGGLLGLVMCFLIPPKVSTTTLLYVFSFLQALSIYVMAIYYDGISHFFGRSVPFT
eukprot:CAMPEP_0174243174 /NCGR_PEP_ID=MMETSP0417-20130205/30652_1 /TAXON_ID=242541 /ORGANISM="Mayorella sp, Strain BSH-02190019" /LENGTH=488 /DNA_ID=CAMNT_0015322645 /DNA_START=214 /DNA_END=1676 /DNA_ORIENTATION=-